MPNIPWNDVFIGPYGGESIKQQLKFVIIKQIVVRNCNCSTRVSPHYNAAREKLHFFGRQGAKRKWGEAVLKYREVNFRFATPPHGKRQLCSRHFNEG